MLGSEGTSDVGSRELEIVPDVDSAPLPSDSVEVIETAVVDVVVVVAAMDLVVGAMDVVVAANDVAAIVDSTDREDINIVEGAVEEESDGKQMRSVEAVGAWVSMVERLHCDTGLQLVWPACECQHEFIGPSPCSQQSRD